jgi:folylpolyglutamate synthase/dihydropteroate synthase
MLAGFFSNLIMIQTNYKAGLGGNRDSTNVIILPLACGTTSIDHDHFSYLENTLIRITKEKSWDYQRKYFSLYYKY